MKKFLIYIFRFIYKYMRYFILLFIIISFYIIFYYLDDIIYLFHQIYFENVYAEAKKDDCNNIVFNNYQVSLLKALLSFTLKKSKILKNYKNYKNYRIKKFYKKNNKDEDFYSILSVGLFKFYLRIRFKIYEHSDSAFYKKYKKNFFYNKMLKDFKHMKNMQKYFGKFNYDTTTNKFKDEILERLKKFK